MHHPIALRLRPGAQADVYTASIDPSAAKAFDRPRSGPRPAVVVTSKATMLPDVSAGMIDARDVLAVSDGDWDNCVIIVVDHASEVAVATTGSGSGDHKFLEQVKSQAKDIYELAKKTLEDIRKSGVDGDLVEVKGGRWVNRPKNTFTLKAQPKAGNVHFTLYGNPDTYDADGFLLKDQNSYSRGWVRSNKDAERLAGLARIAHSRRK